MALYGDYEPPSDEGVLDAYVDGDYSYNGPGTSERFFFVAPLPVNGGGDLSTEAVLGPRDSDNERPRPPSLEDVAGVDGVGVQQLLDARGEGSLGYVAAGAPWPRDNSTDNIRDISLIRKESVFESNTTLDVASKLEPSTIILKRTGVAHLMSVKRTQKICKHLYHPRHLYPKHSAFH